MLSAGKTRPMNFERARLNMVEQQLRTWEVLDQRVLNVISETPREDYVPAPYRRLAYADTSIPLYDDQVMMPPRVEARLLQALDLKADDYVLEIGTGSGYLTALLARLAGQVVSVEISPECKQQAQVNLTAHGVQNVRLELGDGVRGWPESAPYDAIAVTGSVPLLEQHYQHQLKTGGRLFVIVGEMPIMEALLITRLDANEWSQDNLFETVVPPLQGAKTPQRFIL